MSELHFLRAEWFFALIPLAIIVFFLHRIKTRHRGWQNFCDKRLLPFLLTQQNTKQKHGLMWLLVVGGLLLITALAGPVWEQRPIPVFKKQSALVLILDLSASMDATDIKPSRLTRARLKLRDILAQRKEGQTALIVFAGEAFTVTPLTDDTQTIAAQVPSLTTTIMPSQGSNSNSALLLAEDLLQQAGQTNGEIILLTDGVNTASLATAQKLTQQGYRLSILAVGTQDAGPIPQAQGGFVKDASGAIVIPSVNFQLLTQLAALGHGQIQKLSADDTDIENLLVPLQRLQLSDKSKQTELKTDSWYEAGPYLLLLLLPLAGYAFRKGIIAGFIIVVMFPLTPDYANAFEWSQLWRNQNQRAVEQLKNNQAQTAATQFTDPKWKAAALYKAGEYQQALEIYNKLENPDSESLYNKANTLAKLGNIEQAIKTYDEVLQQASDHKDAKYNRDLLKQQQQQKQQSQQGDKNSQDQQQQDQNQQSDQQQQSQNQQQQAGQQQPSQQDNNNEQGQQQNQSRQNQAQNQPSQAAEQQQQQQAEKNNAEKKQAEQQAQQDQDNNQAEPESAQRQPQQSEQQTEQQQATEQWLRRIPDDPGGLLRRKFRYQAQQRQYQQPDDTNGQAQW